MLHFQRRKTVHEVKLNLYILFDLYNDILALLCWNVVKTIIIYFCFLFVYVHYVDCYTIKTIEPIHEKTNIMDYA